MAHPEPAARPPRYRYYPDMDILRIIVQLSCRHVNDYDAENRLMCIDSTAEQVAQAEEDIKDSYIDHYKHCLNVAVCCKAFAFEALREMYRDLAFLMSDFAGGRVGSVPVGHLARSVLPCLETGTASRQLLEEGASLWPNMRTLYMDMIADQHLSYNASAPTAFTTAFLEDARGGNGEPPKMTPYQPLPLAYPNIRAVRRYRSEVVMQEDERETYSLRMEKWPSLEVFTGSGNSLPRKALKELHLHCVGERWQFDYGDHPEWLQDLEALTVHGFGRWEADSPCFAWSRQAQALVDSLGQHIRHLSLRINLHDDSVGGQTPQYGTLSGPTLLKRFPHVETLDVSRFFVNREFFEELIAVNDDIPLRSLKVALQMAGNLFAGASGVSGEAEWKGPRTSYAHYPVEDFTPVNLRQVTVLDITGLPKLKRAASRIINHDPAIQHSADAFVAAHFAAAKEAYAVAQ